VSDPLHGEFDSSFEPEAETEAHPRAGALPGPTRPDKISIWPVEDDRYGIDVLYHGVTGFRRADQVQRQLDDIGVVATLRQEGDAGWIVRFGPVGRSEMLAVLNGYVW
jgi:hypothetical protein